MTEAIALRNEAGKILWVIKNHRTHVWISETETRIATDIERAEIQAYFNTSSYLGER